MLYLLIFLFLLFGGLKLIFGMIGLAFRAGGVGIGLIVLLFILSNFM